MANTPTSNSSIKDTDILSSFTQKAQKIVLEYFKYILILLLVSLSIFGGTLLWKYLENRKNQAAEEELHLVRSALVDAEKKAKGEILSPPSSNQLFDTAKKATEYTQEMKQKAEVYLSRIQHYSHLPAGALSAMEMAYFLRAYDKNKQALELLETTDKSFKKKNSLRVLLAFQLSMHWMNQEKYQKALKKLEWIQQQEIALWLKPDVLLRIGLIYEKLNQPLQAAAIYKQITKEFAKSQTAARAEQYLNLIQIKKALKSKLNP